MTATKAAPEPFEGDKPACPPFSPDSASLVAASTDEAPFVAGDTATLRLTGDVIPVTVTVIHTDAERVVVERADNGEWLWARASWLERA